MSVILFGKTQIICTPFLSEIFGNCYHSFGLTTES